MIKKTYIPGKPRNPKLGTATGTSGVGKTEFNNVAGSSHEHSNKGVLDRITEAMLVGALRDLITSTDTESELTDENILSALRVLGEITKNNEAFLEDLKERFLSKIEPDTAQKLITFVEGLEVGAFTTGALGSGAAVKMIDGTSYAEVDNLTVRQKATFRELIIESLKHIGGQLVLTPARMKCVRVVDGGTFYKCYFDTGDGEVSNEFVAGDYARCQVFTGSGTKFYWRLVTLVGEDWINLSKTTAAVGSDAPEAGDDITQLGNATDTERQSAIILSTVGIDAPSWKQYSGINSFSLEGKETTVFSKLGNRISGETVFTSGGANLDDYLDGVAQDMLDALQAAQDAEDKAQQAIEDAEANVATINTEVGKLQDQIDGKVSNWFYDYTPTLSNYPASDWDTTLLKDSHIGDTFTNTEPAPAENAGKSWRFVKNVSVYSWTLIADSDAVKALLEASKAQATADGKSTTHLFQPTKYKLGDMWVLNAAQTVNGTLYKQGELLTATQDSETFVQAHWLKRIRYTDDTAIDKLEIGGRNLISNLPANWENGYLDASGNKQPGVPYLRMKAFHQIKANQKYIINTEPFYQITGRIRNSSGVVIDTFGRDRTESSPLLFTTPSDAADYSLYIANSDLSGLTPSSISDVKIRLYEGEKDLKYSPSPEDVQARIDGLEIGWRNLLLNTNRKLENSLYPTAYFNLGAYKPIQGETVTIAFKGTLGAGKTHFGIFNSTDTVSMVTIAPSDKGADGVFRKTFQWNIGGSPNTSVRIYPMPNSSVVSSVEDVMLVVGNKIAYYSEAPEDVDKKISDVDAKAQALEYLKLAIGQDAKVNGALYTLVTILLKEDMNADVTAGVSGLRGAGKNLPAFWAGGTDVQAQQGTAKAIIRHDGSAKFTDADITGVINALEGTIGGLSLEGKKLFSQNHKLQIDGEEATIALLDPNTDTLRTIIKPTNIATSVASYFASSSISPVSMAGIKANYTKTIWNLVTSSMTLNATGGKTFEVSIPAFNVTMGVTHPGGAGIGSVYARTAVYLTNGSSMKQPLTSLASIITSTGGTFSKTDSYPAQKAVITNSGNYYLRVELTHSPEAVSPNGQFSSTATNFTASEVVNRSEIGSNGMVIATSDTNYSFMVGNTFEVRRGSKGLRITDAGIEKFNGTSWVTANI